jgi:hypothetical protein
MKSITLLGIYLMSFVIIYMMLTMLGLVFSEASYISMLRGDAWMMIYSLFLGPWLSIFPAREYYIVHEEYFDRVF